MYIQVIIYKKTICNKELLKDFFDSLQEIMEREEGVLKELLKEVKETWEK